MGVVEGVRDAGAGPAEAEYLFEEGRVGLEVAQDLHVVHRHHVPHRRKAHVVNVPAPMSVKPVNVPALSCPAQSNRALTGPSPAPPSPVAAMPHSPRGNAHALLAPPGRPPRTAARHTQPCPRVPAATNKHPQPPICQRLPLQQQHLWRLINNIRLQAAATNNKRRETAAASQAASPLSV